MPKTVVFHIGLPKTGTTTIQSYLRSQEAKLRALGILYPGLSEHAAMGRFKHLLILSAMLGNDPPKSGGLDAKGCRAVIARTFMDFRDSNLDCLLWSHEGISTRAFDLDADYMRELLADLNVRIVLSARYIDDWIESLYKERIRARGGRGRGRTERAKPRTKTTPLLPIAPPPGAAPRRPKSMLEEGAEIPGSLRALRKILPSAEIIVQSYDDSRDEGTVVSSALAAMGVPVASAFGDADSDAAVRNPTKSNLYSMLVYHLVMGQADADVIRAVTKATKIRARAGLEFEPLRDRRFRFLSEDNIINARGYYEDLRRDFPHLPVQPPHTPDPAERSLPKEDGLAVLDWLRPDISDADFAKAQAAYAPI